MAKEEKLINYDPSNEQILFANAMHSKESLKKIMLLLKEDNFVGKRHKVIFNTLKKINDEGLEYHEDTFDKLADGEYGGFKYLRNIQKAYVENPNLDKHIELQISLSIKYIAQMQDLDKLQEMMSDPNAELNIIDDYLKKMSVKFKTATFENQIVKGKDIKTEYLKDIRNRIQNKDFCGFGFDQLDDYLTEGVMKKKIILIAGRTSMGKTTYVANVLKHWKSKKKKVLVCALESGRQSIIDAMVSKELHIYLMTLVKNPGSLEKDVFMKMRNLLDDLFTDEYIQFWNDEIPLTLNNVLKVCENGSFDICVIDLFEKLKDVIVEGPGRNIDSKLDDLQMGVKTADVSMVITSQIRRLGDRSKRDSLDNTKPTLEHIKNAGKYEEVSDLIIFLYRAHYYDTSLPDVLEQIVAKQRRGSRNVSACNEFIADFATIGKKCDDPTLNSEGFGAEEDDEEERPRPKKKKKKKKPSNNENANEEGDEDDE